ncbi:threonine--tRNA ligase [Paremcibacter congregatus]|uniref:Threonine--tRNA ligase n=1 Tax=Paremcibacter congregatus TaxID=2043170 RepID=A0A2G4YRJ1_9PROT|nr:threonine--tRNA ligase [Paremcibacter congregatus]PHZ84928.1 threonine--tRNA ligase [Paremcibacter congregatus]QDE26097.1 threonine--tRNA ligase [Paremcibacter congregatus]
MNTDAKVALTLPDGSVRTYPGPVTGSTLASDIGPGLAKAAIVIVVDGEQWDLSREITQDADVSIITNRDDAALEILRHDAAHIMAEAVKELYPDTQVTIGPAIENGFYYDFARKDPFSTDDLEGIEKRMREIIERDEEIIRREMDRNDAVKFFADMGETYKAELIAAIPEGQTITLYRQGDFIDLCRGPHLPSTGKLDKDSFKLMKVAGAYWRGDSNNEMLQRIYGTAWRNKKELKAYLLRLEEAEKRDHRKLGREMNLFHFQEEAAGMPFWHPNGWTIYQEVEAYMRRKQKAYGYQEIKTPQLVDRKLWEASGHWEKFREHMYTTEADERALAFKPMNCPCHVQVFNQGIVSYRDLPLRLAEFGSCHRYEPSGALHGLMRVRAFVQDDAHIFCAKDQITSETVTFCQMLKEVYEDFGFTDLKVKFSDRPDVRAGSDETWDEAEKALKDAVDTAGLDYTMNPGEGAFYGPKLEFVLVDAIGRDWQCGTMQVDFVLPERLNANFIGSDNEKHRPVMLHRAILGSFERFIGILIEEHAGRFPVWLAPTQVVVTGITSDQDAAVEKVYTQLKAAGLRAEMDIRNEKINYKIREHSHAKVPAIFVIGAREAEESTVTVRRLGSKNQETVDLADAIHKLKQESYAPDLRS